MRAAQGKKQALIIADKTDGAVRLEELLSGLSDGEWSVRHTDSLRKAVEAIINDRIDSIFIGLDLNGGQFGDLVRTISHSQPDFPLIVFAYKANEAAVKEAIACGAQEYLEMADIGPERLQRQIAYAAERKRIELSYVQAKKQLEQNSVDIKNAYREIVDLLDELKTKNEELEELSRLKSNFVSIVSHELRTPLTYIKEGISQVLEGLHGDINEDQKEFLTISCEGVARLEEIVNNLLDMSKIEAGKVDLRRDFTDLRKTVANVAAGFRSIFSKKGLYLKSVFPRDELDIYCDADKIIQVLNNLLSNAYKFTGKGGVIIEVEKTRTDVVVKVSDTGIGMSRQSLGKIFDKFIQISRKDGPGIKGTGLGLGIAKGLVELHGGTMEVESVLDRGTVFSFTLPLLSREEIFYEQLQKQIEISAENETDFSVIIVTLEATGPVVPRKAIPEKKTIMDSLEKIMRSTLHRTSDTVFRTSDDEYIVFLPNTDWKGAFALRRRFEDQARSYVMGFETDYLTELPVMSGSATYPTDAHTGEKLLSKARDSLKKLYMGDERRRALRIPVEIVIKGTNEKGEQVEFRTVNISTGGVCVSSSRYMELPELNDILITLPGDFGSLSVRAFVSWTRNLEEKGEYHIGLKFMDLPEKERVLLSHYLDSQKKPPEDT